MKRLLAGLALMVAAATLSGCYYDPGYVRSAGYGGVYYTQAAPVYDGYYAPGYYDGGYYGYYGYNGYGYYGCCYGPGVNLWYGGPGYGYYRGGYGYRGYGGGHWRGAHGAARGSISHSSGGSRTGH